VEASTIVFFNVANGFAATLVPSRAYSHHNYLQYIASQFYACAQGLFVLFSSDKKIKIKITTHSVSRCNKALQYRVCRCQAIVSLRMAIEPHEETKVLYAKYHGSDRKQLIRKVEE
jgi:hypothetical protein